MEEYGYPEKLKRAISRILVWGGLPSVCGIVARFVIIELPRLRIGTILWGEGYFFVVAPENIWKLRLGLAGIALFCLLLGWVLVLSASAMYGRIHARTYWLEDTALVRRSGKREKRVEIAPSTVVRYGKIRGLSVRTGKSRMSVPAKLTCADELAGELREKVLAAGGEYDESTYEKAVAGALESRWATEHLWKCVVTVLGGLVVAAGGAYVTVGKSSQIDLVSWRIAAFTYLAMALSLETYGVPWRFRGWNKPGWQAPSAAYAWGTFGLWAFISAAVPLGLLVAVFM